MIRWAFGVLGAIFIPGSAIEAHVEADGLLVMRGSEVVVHVWQGTVTGSIPVPIAGTTDAFDVHFLDPDSLVFQPGPPETTWLRSLVESPTTLAFDSLGTWSFALTGLAEDPSAALRLRIWYDDHYDFTSPSIPCPVGTVLDVPGVRDGKGVVTLAPVPSPTRRVAPIELELREPGGVVVDVVDVLGRRASVWRRTSLPAGRHLVPIPALRAGVYLIRVRSGGDELTAKVQVLP